MLTQPHTPASDSATNGNGHARKPGRDGKGRFTPGNRLGRGNPFARQVAALRTALLNRVTPETMREIADTLITRARIGDLAAIKLLFTYVLGKPTEQPDPDRLDRDEWRILQEEVAEPEERERLSETLSIRLALPQAKATLEEREAPHLCVADGLTREVAEKNARTQELFDEGFRVYWEQKPAPRPVKDLFRPREEAPQPGQPAPSPHGGNGAPEQAAPAAPPSAKRGAGAAEASANGKPVKPGARAGGAAPSPNGSHGRLEPRAALSQEEEAYWAEFDALFDDAEDDKPPSPDGGDGPGAGRE